MSAKSIAFFVGSGISLKSKAPTVANLTHQILESAWQEHTDWRFYPIPENEGTSSTGLAADAQNLIRLIHEQIEGHIAQREGRSPNYEDHFACLKQIVQDETFEIVNPMIGKNVEYLKAAAATLYLRTNPHIDNNRFASLAERASDLIQCIVFNALRNIESIEGLELFTDAAKLFPEMDIFSLNHDILIESLFEKHNLPYADGFGERDGDAFLFNGSWKKHEPGIRIFKLHGSVDWYRVRSKSRGVDQYAKLRKNPNLTEDSRGDWLDLLEIVPNFLTGTTVKEQAYGYGIYGEVFEQFRHRLREHSTLVVSGYGWGDKGINIRLNQWLGDKKENRIIILHGSGEVDVRHKRFWQWKWDDCYKSGKVQVVPKWFSEFTADELSQLV